MEKLFKKKGSYACYKGVDKEMIINHSINHNNEIMVIFADIEDLKNNYPYEISTNFILIYEIPIGYNDYPSLVDNFIKNWKLIEDQVGYSN